MTSPDERLAALFAADLPPARDTGFQAGVLEELARRRFLNDLALWTAACGVGGAVFWLLWPALAPTVVILSRSLAPGAIAAVAAASILAITSGRILSPRS